MEEMEENGVWVLYGGGDVENVSVLRSGSKGELDGEGEGVTSLSYLGDARLLVLMFRFYLYYRLAYPHLPDLPQT
jgi:hypothetical protein